MKLRVTTIDLELSRRAKLLIGGALLGGAAALTTSLALANVPNHFQPGQTLKAAELEGNFNEIDADLNALKAQVAALEAASTSKSSVRAAGIAPVVLPAQTFVPIKFTTEFFDEGSEFEPTQGTFTANADGKYLVCATLATGDEELEIDAFVNGSRVDALAHIMGQAPFMTGSGCEVLALNAHDVLDFRLFANVAKTIHTYGDWEHINIDRLK